MGNHDGPTDPGNEPKSFVATPTDADPPSVDSARVLAKMRVLKESGSTWLWPSEDRGPFRITVKVEPVNGRQDVVSLTIQSDKHAFGGARRPITGELLRALKMSEVRSRALQEWASVFELAGRSSLRTAEQFSTRTATTAETDYALSQMAEALLAMAEDVERRAANSRSEASDRAPHSTEDHYLDVAVLYADAWQRGENPTAAVREAFGLSQRTAARRVEDARNTYGFLYKTKARKADGRLTAKAKRALEARRTRNEGDSER